jgi:hypothetical protein
MNRYQIETTLTNDYRNLDTTDFPPDEAHYAGQIFTSKHTDVVFAPSPIQALKKLAFPKIGPASTIEITIHVIPEPLGLVHNSKTKHKT